ncbi:hypothetical protein LLG95_18675 [bacterium]|nr:hypothetical protein [bacterium]
MRRRAHLHRAWSCRPERDDDRLVPDGFVAWVLRECGMCDLSAYRAGALQRRVPACLRALRVSSIREARQLLGQHPHLLQAALNALLIGVTGFFRDRIVFETLRRDVIPVVARRSGGVRVLAAGCSGGQELYSLAMLVAEQGALDRSFFLGLDCRADAIAEAAAGVFKPDALEGVDPALRDQYFVADGTSRRAIPALRSRMQWRKADLLYDRPRGTWDVVLFRNVAIYMLPRAVHQLWAGIVDSLSVGGFLVTGKSERPAAHLPLVRLANCIYQKRQDF